MCCRSLCANEALKGKERGKEEPGQTVKPQLGLTWVDQVFDRGYPPDVPVVSSGFLLT